MTGDGEAAPLECPRELWRVLELVEEVAVAIALKQQLQPGRIDSLLSQLHRRQEVRVTIDLLTAMTVEVGRMLDPSRRRAGWLKLPGVRAPAEPGGLTEDANPKGILWAIRQSLYLAAMCISAAAHQPPGLAQELVDRKIRNLEKEDLWRIRDTTELVFIACEKVLLALKDSSIEADN